MKLLLLKILLQRRARDEGFTLPMVIALGLVMLLLGAVSIVKSSEENITAISQNSSSDAIAIAEVGVTKYRELLNQNRILTIYNHDQWHTNATITAQTCDDMTTAPKAINPLTGILEPIWTGTATKPNDDAASAVDEDDNWWTIQEDSVDPDNPIGEYRLVSYTYDIDDDSATNNNGQFAADDDNPNTTDTFTFNDAAGYNTRGILIVQGRSPDRSEAQIQVEIALRINNLENFAPVLWVGSGAIASPGTLDIPNPDDNIVLRSASAGCSTPAAIAGNSNVISDPRNLPAIIPLPTDINKKNDIGTINTVASELLLPRPTATPSDNKDDQGRFFYEVTTINVENNNLETDGIADVTLYTANDVNISSSDGNTVTIGNSNAANPSGRYANFNNGSTTNTSVSSANLEIYVAGNKTITIETNTSGTVNIEGFIHAPDAILDIKGSGTVNINGAVWVKEFKNTATVNIKSDKTDTTTAAEASYKFYTTSATMTPRPLTSTATDWVREEVQ